MAPWVSPGSKLVGAWYSLPYPSLNPQAPAIWPFRGQLRASWLILASWVGEGDLQLSASVFPTSSKGLESLCRGLGRATLPLWRWALRLNWKVEP